MKLPGGVLDANVIIGLAKGGVFPHLPQLFTDLFLPSEVRLEVIGQGRGRPGASELTAALGAWVTEITPDPTLVATFPAPHSLADRELLAVAHSLGTRYLLTDDRGLRREAHRHGFACLGVAQLVVLMKEEGLIAAVRPVLEQMEQAGHGIDPGEYRQALLAAGE